MKKLLSVLLVTMLLLVCVQLGVVEVSADDYNLLVNGDFESGVIDGWDNHDGRYTVNMVSGYNSNYAISLSVPNIYCLFRQKVTVEKNTDYVFSVRHKNAVDMVLIAKYVNPDQNITQTDAESGYNWTTTTLTFNSGNATEVYVALMSFSGAARGVFDDIVLKPLVNDRLLNGGFEDGAGGWNWGCNAAPVKGNAYIGEYAAKLEFDAPYSDVLAQQVKVKPYTDYVVSWWSCRVSGTGVWTMLPRATNLYYFPVTSQNSFSQTHSDWVQNTVSFNSEGYTSVNITFYTSESTGSDAGVFLLDAILLYEKNAGPSCDHDWAGSSCTQPNQCRICGLTNEEDWGHKYTNDCDATCNLCGYERFANPIHSYTNLCDEYCNVCNAKRTPPHSYTDNCDFDCNICKKIRTITHIYTNDCDETCNVCYAYREVSGHEYTNRCDRDCNLCNAIRMVTHSYSSKCDSTCNYCGTKRKVSAHNYQMVIAAKATTTKNGYYASTCVECGITNGKTTTIRKISTVKLSAISYIYNGKVKTPSVIVKDSNGTTISSGNYTVTYASGRKNAGTYKVIVKFKGKYSGSKTLTFKINPIDISKCKISLSSTSYTYNGSVKKPSVTAKNASGTKLTTSSYTVTYASGRKNVGTYKVTIRMKGNYTGTKTLTFKINPAGTTISKVTAGTKKLTVAITKKTTQVTGYEIQYATNKSFKSAKTKTLTKTSLSLTGLKAKTTYYIRVRTYKVVNGKKVYSVWSAVKSKKTK